jgi:hypothetical protein
LTEVNSRNRSRGTAFFDGNTFRYFFRFPFRSRSYRNVYPKKSELSFFTSTTRVFSRLIASQNLPSSFDSTSEVRALPPQFPEKWIIVGLNTLAQAYECDSMTGGLLFRRGSGYLVEKIAGGRVKSIDLMRSLKVRR